MNIWNTVSQADNPVQNIMICGGGQAFEPKHLPIDTEALKKYFFNAVEKQPSVGDDVSFSERN